MTCVPFFDSSISYATISGGSVKRWAYPFHPEVEHMIYTQDIADRYENSPPIQELSFEFQKRFYSQKMEKKDYLDTYYNRWQSGIIGLENHMIDTYEDEPETKILELFVFDRPAIFDEIMGLSGDQITHERLCFIKKSNDIPVSFKNTKYPTDEENLELLSKYGLENATYWVIFAPIE